MTSVRVVGGRAVAVRLARTLAAAEAAGIGYACLDASVEYAGLRERGMRDGQTWAPSPGRSRDQGLAGCHRAAVY